jgi:hypothetical protein
MAHWKPKDDIEIVEIASNLFRISADGRKHVYFLVGVRGNVLFHGPDRIPFYKNYADFFDHHGGIGLQALTHAGDASKACAHVADVWGAPIWVNEWELAQARAETGISIEKGFANDEPLAPGVESIHLPGHAVGMTAFLCRLEQGAFLIAGHAIKPMPKRDRWSLHTSAPLVEVALRSLTRLRELDVDFLCPDLTHWGPPPLSFGPNERTAITATVAEYLAKKHSLEQVRPS